MRSSATKSYVGGRRRHRRDRSAMPSRR
jgi:hypothetical protein